MTDRELAAPIRKTPLHAEHQKLGGKLVPFAGFEMPIQYSGIVREHQAVRGAAGLFDVSHMGELRLTGGLAAAFANSLVTNDLEAVACGQAMYTCCCREDGGILDDLILYKQAADNILIVCNASNHSKIAAHVAAQAKGKADVSLTDESDETSLLALQGPRAFEVLKVAEPSLGGLGDELRPFHFSQRSLAGAVVTLARTGYTGEDGVEIFCRPEDAARVWRLLLTAGESYGILPVGLGARDTLRLEARLSLYGNELDEQTNPLEAGLGWTVKLNKGDFIGRSALLRARDAGIPRRLVGFEMTGRGVGRHGYPVLAGVQAGAAVVGHVTSGCPSPSLGKAIGLCMVPAALAEVGTEFGIDCRGKVIAARAVATPFYRRPSAK